MHWAARHNDTTILELILERGADVRVADQAGFTALHFCAFANAVDTCRILLDKGADIDAKSAKGYTAVCSAAEHHKVHFPKLRSSRLVSLKPPFRFAFTLQTLFMILSRC